MKVSRIALIVVVMAAAIQLYRPAKTNPVVDPTKTLQAHTRMPPDVAQAIDRSCTDCHTNKTVWPKYSHIAPVSWLVTDDVNEGRRHMNFSEWGTYSAERRQRELGQICDEIKDGGMPLKQYTWMHKGTALDQPQRDAICAWTQAEQQRITAQTGVPVPQKKQGGMHAE
jgi:hypothetical protein